MSNQKWWFHKLFYNCISISLEAFWFLFAQQVFASKGEVNGIMQASFITIGIHDMNNKL